MSKSKEVLSSLKKVKLSMPKFDFNFKKLKDRFNSDKVVKGIVIALVFVFSFSLIDLLVQYLNNSYSVAIVNGVRITKSQYYDRLEKTYGLTTVENLTNEELVKQGANKEGVVVSNEEVIERLNEYYNENGGKDAVLATLKANSITESDVKGQIKVSLQLEKALAKRVTYTDEDLKTFFDQYKSVIYGAEKVKFEDKKEEITEYYTNQKVQELRDSWISELSQDAKIQNNIAAKPEYGFLKTTINIFKNLFSEISSK